MKNFLLFIGCVCSLAAANAQIPQFAWARQIGDTLDDQGIGLTIDAQGNIYATGLFSGTADFDPGAGTFTLASAGNTDIFVSKTNAAGNFMWARSIGGPGIDVGNAVSVDALGNVYTTGWFNDTADFNPGTGTFTLSSAGLDDMFISKLDASGNFVWAKSIGDTLSNQGGDVSIDASGNVYLLGYFKSIADLDPGPGVSTFTSNGGTDVFIMKLDASGNFLWAKQRGGITNDYPYSIVVKQGGVYVAISFNGTVDMDPGPATVNVSSAGGYDMSITKLDGSGNLVWVKTMGGAQSDEAFNMKLDASGNIYATGYFQGTADFDPGSGISNLTATTSYDMFVLKLDAAGDFVWAKKLGGAMLEFGLSLTPDSFGNVYTTGFYSGTVDFDPGSAIFYLTSAGDYDIFISKLDPAGDFVWAASFGSIYQDAGRSISADAMGNVYTIGSFQANAVDFDPGASVFNLIPKAGSSDIFLHKITPPPSTVGSDVQNKNAGVRLYPNPFNDQLHVNFPELPGHAKIEIHDVCGQLVYSVDNLEKTNVIDLKNLRKGVYFVRVTGNNGWILTEKIIRE